ncbi:hypothetical protein F5X68DRAFT_272591 [Plectosphaerella plurivora]|uniref:Uncharacterized protein n=1 Tax=Plectosphaerella plurivora TaxID=936078 RepID=A0A9P8VLC1_9PEZI|nr:hypothetical protein F5X68DRAFT_272591 [Plectosphaerella plurivora]
MGKKKRGHPDVEDILARPWCYYCERDFEDLKLLISHQKAKHFKCDRCGRRLNTAGGLSVHLNQVHKETLNQVENALPNRQGLDVEIFGMEGIPHEILEQHRNRIVQNFYQAQEDRRIATGNPIPGHGKPPKKKVKIEAPGELKARFAEHRARIAAARAAGIDPHAPPPSLPPTTESPGAFNNSPYPPPQAPYAAPPAGVPPFPPQQQGYGYSPSSLPARPGSGPPAPPGGLPQRPDGGFYGGQTGDEIDQLIRMAESGIRPAQKPEAEAAAAAPSDKKAKKGARMVYADENFSPEELMAQLPRYAYVPPAS